MYFKDGFCQFRMVGEAINCSQNPDKYVSGKSFSGYFPRADQVLSHEMDWEGSPIKEKLESISISSKSLSMGRLTVTQREVSRALLDQGVGPVQIAAQMGCDPSTIRRIRQRVAQTGSTADRPRPGRRRVTTRRQDRQIQRENMRLEHHGLGQYIVSLQDPVEHH
mgnify:CR=1 FL=1